MKYLKRFESNKTDIDFIDIINILQDVIDEGHYVVIYSANGVAFYPDDVNDKNKMNTFRFNRWNNDTSKSFKFRVDFDEYKGYHELVDFLDEMKSVVGRFKDLGFELSNFYVNTDHDNRKTISVEYNFECV